MEEDGALSGQYLLRGGPNHALRAAGSSQTAGPGGHLHQQGVITSPGPDSMGYFGVSLDKTFPPAVLELEEGLHHFGQATEAGSCSGHPSGEALQPEVPTGISINLLPHFRGRGHLMRELANRRTMHGLVVGARTCPTPTSPE